MKRNILFSLILLASLGLLPHRPIRAEAEPWSPLPGPYGGSVATLALSPDYATDHTLFAGLPTGRCLSPPACGPAAITSTAPPTRACPGRT
jgi:hypothetical protein